MKKINYAAFAREATQISLLCLAVVAIFGSFGASNKTMLVAFTMAVMSSAVLYRHGERYARNISLSCMLIGSSIAAGGIIGYYSQFTAELLILVYAILAFYLPNSRQRTSIFVSGALMFLVFSSMPFTWQTGVKYFFDSMIVALIFFVYYRFLNPALLAKDYAYTDQPLHIRTQSEKRLTATIALLSLSIATVAGHVIHEKYHLPNIYWIELTILMVIQGPYYLILTTTIKRMAVNTVGALISVLIFGFLLPHSFWPTLAAQTIILFMIFFTSFSYSARVFFIELFILGFAYLISLFHTMIAVDRVVLSVTGGLIVIAVTLFVWAADKLTPTTRISKS